MNILRTFLAAAEGSCSGAAGCFAACFFTALVCDNFSCLSLLAGGLSGFSEEAEMPSVMYSCVIYFKDA